MRFSVTVRQDTKIRITIEAIPESAWTPIPYWLSTPEVSGADVAETTYRAFAHTNEALDVRLIVPESDPPPDPSFRRHGTPPLGAVHGQRRIVALSVMAHNLGRAVGILAGHDLPGATTASLQRRLFTVQAGSCTPPDDSTYDYPNTGPWKEAF